MFKSKAILAIALAFTLVPLNSMAMNQVEGQQPGAAQALAPAAQPAANNSWASLKRKLIKPISFLCGAAAVGGVLYAGNTGHKIDDRSAYASLISLWSLVGGYIAMSYTETEVNNNYVPPVIHRGSLAASLGFSATAAGIGLAATKVSNGTNTGGLFTLLAGYLVGNAMYYAN